MRQYLYNITKPYIAETFRGLIFIRPIALMYDLTSYVAHIVCYIRGSQSHSSPCAHMCERVKAIAFVCSIVSLSVCPVKNFELGTLSLVKQLLYAVIVIAMRYVEI